MPMGIHLVENDRGRRRIHPVGVVLLMISCLAVCMALPSWVAWLVFGKWWLVWDLLALGFTLGCSVFSAILSARLRCPLKSLPLRSGVGGGPG